MDITDIVRGYEYEPGNYVLLEDHELDAIKIETKHTIDLTRFVDADDIDPLDLDKPYFLFPDGDIAAEGYCVIRDALREMRKVGIGQLTLRGKEYIVGLYPTGAGMIVETLRYNDEVKDVTEAFADIAQVHANEDVIEMAKDLVRRKSGAFEPEGFRNHYHAALRELVEAKVRTGGGVAVGSAPTSHPGFVVDFMEALRKSVEAAAKENAPKPQAPPAPAAASRATPAPVKRSTAKKAS